MRSPPLERESTVYRHFPVLLLLLACFAFAMPVMAGERPIVGINMALSDKDTSETTPRTTDVGLSLRSTYVDAVIAAGGLPVLIPPVLAEDRIPEYCDLVDAFLFVGGPDINPRRYGQDPHALWNPINPRREQFDFLLDGRRTEDRESRSSPSASGCSSSPSPAEAPWCRTSPAT